MSLRWYQVFLLAITATFSFVQCDHHGCPAGYDRQQYLDGETQKYLLCWKVDWSDQSITFVTKVATTGWVGLGFSPTGFMPNSDVVIGWVKDGRGYLKDRFAATRTVPPIDAIQNVQLLSSSEADGLTTLEFKRKLAACEPKDRSIEEGTTRVIFSYNPNDPVSEDSPAKHTVTGRVSINLLSGTGNVEPAPLEADHKIFNLLNPNVSVPAQPTTYWCSPFKLPVLQNEAHIIRFDPVVQQNHEELVHHILVYLCTDKIEPYLNMSWDCDNPPFGVPGCRGESVVTAWAVGGAGMTFPSNVGLPVSGATGAQYVLMETHYNNVQSRSTYIDSSGIKVYYTPTKRQYDGAILEIGHFVSYNLLLPPGLSEIDLQNTCPGTCTQAGLPSDGVTVFASMLHSHTVGTGVWVEHIRNGTKLPAIDQNYNYDFNFQDVTLLRDEVKILPGDDIQVFCRYDTSDRTAVTLGGEGTLDEMCLAFLFVYPKPTMGQCLSQIPYDVLRNSYITPAAIAGYFVSHDNQTADLDTRTAQFRKDLRAIDFRTESATQQWMELYWSSRQREYRCSLAGSLSGQYSNEIVLEEIANRTNPTMGTPGPCVGITEGPKLTPTPAAPGSALRLFSSFIPIVIGSVMVYMTVG